LLHATWLASLPADERQPWFAGLVPYSRLATVFAFFGLGVRVMPATNEGGLCPRAPGGVDFAARFNPRADPIINVPPGSTNLTATYYLVSQPGGLFHLTPHAHADEMQVVDTPPTRGMIGLISRQLLPAELGSILQATHQRFLQSWVRLHGALVSPTAAASNLPNVGFPPYVQLPALPVRAQTLDFVLRAADYDLACHLGQDLKDHPEALDLREFNPGPVGRGLHTLAKNARAGFRRGERHGVRLHLYHGAPGSGKTHTMIQDIVARHARTPFSPADLRFHCWLKSLRGPLEATVVAQLPFLMSHNFQTGCMPFAQPLGGVLVLDDATQLWPGYIPLLIATNPSLTDIYCSFDCSQGRSAFPIADSLVRHDISTAEWLAPLSHHYATVCHRLSDDNSALFGFPVPALRPGYPALQGNVHIVGNVVPDLPLLVVSPRFATSKASGGQRCSTFQDCQGFTIDGDVTIDLGGLSATATDGAWWTALTRARGNILLFLGPLSQAPGLLEPMYGQSNIASALVAVAAGNYSSTLRPDDDHMQIVARSVQAHLSRCLSTPACIALGLIPASPVVGYVPQRADWLDQPRDSFLADFWTARSARAQRHPQPVGNPAFSRHSATVTHAPDSVVPNLLRHYASIPNDHVLHMDSTDYLVPSAPLLTIAPDPALNFDKAVDGDLREIVAPNTDSTCQHVFDGPNAILHHTRRDRITTRISEKKRIRIGTDSAVLDSAQRHRFALLKRGFAKFFDVPSWNQQGFSMAQWERSGRNAYKSWCSKRTKAQIRRSIAKNPLDSPCTMAHLFLKAQYIKKEESRFSPAKAGQTVSEFNMVRSFRDATAAHYIEELANKYAFPSTYLHSHASPSMMDRWYTRNWRRGPMTANDYTAWDSGCRAEFLAFDLWVMRLSGIPEEYMALYEHERLNITSYLGPHMVRQESGDRWTWLLNTLRNAALTGARLDCPPRTPACFSGDDSLVCGHFLGSKTNRASDWAMTPKTVYGSTALFCGYEFGGLHIALGADVVLHRSQYGLALGRSDPDYWRSIADAIAEAGLCSPDYSAVLSTARENLLQAAVKYGFPISGPLVFRTR